MSDDLRESLVGDWSLRKLKLAGRQVMSEIDGRVGCGLTQSELAAGAEIVTRAIRVAVEAERALCHSDVAKYVITHTDGTEFKRGFDAGKQSALFAIGFGRCCDQRRLKLRKP
jgi:hypothetical protein